MSVLQSVADIYVPKRHKGFFKYWFDEELRLLKQESIDSNRAWKAAGKPRHGPLFSKRQSCRLLYRKRIRDKQRTDTEVYTNDLHEALSQKNGFEFWKCWRSKFESNAQCKMVEGCVDADVIVDKFASHFKSAFTCNDPQRANLIKDDYLATRSAYHGLPLTGADYVDTELVSSVISKLAHGKTLDIGGLSAEHLYYCHPSLPVILSQMFHLVLLCSYIPGGFRHSYIVSIPTSKQCVGKALTCDDFRGIAVSPILSKVFEHCILKRFEPLFVTSKISSVLRKALAVVTPYALFVVRLMTLFVEVALPICVLLTCPKLSIKLITTRYI